MQSAWKCYDAIIKQILRSDWPTYIVNFNRFYQELSRFPIDPSAWALTESDIALCGIGSGLLDYDNPGDSNDELSDLGKRVLLS